jgi:hypothetical protein
MEGMEDERCIDLTGAHLENLSRIAEETTAAVAAFGRSIEVLLPEQEQERLRLEREWERVRIVDEGGWR